MINDYVPGNFTRAETTSAKKESLEKETGNTEFDKFVDSYYNYINEAHSGVSERIFKQFNPGYVALRIQAEDSQDKGITHT